MTYLFWIALAATALGLLLLFGLGRLLRSEVVSGGARRGAAAYWPIAAVLLLLAACWVLYSAGAGRRSIQAEAPVALIDWEIDPPNGLAIRLNGTKFAAKYRGRYHGLAIARVEDDAVAANADRVIDKSTAFALPDGNADLSIRLSAQALARMNQPHPISLYVAIVPLSVGAEDITTLDSIAAHGGSILSMVQIADVNGVLDQEDQLP
jgi:hypothetical protein